MLTVVLAVVSITVIYVAKAVVVPLALAVLFAFLLAPLVTLLERIRLPRVLAIVIVISAAGGLLGAVGWTVFQQLIEVTDHLPAYTSNINDKMDSRGEQNQVCSTLAQVVAQAGLVPPEISADMPEKTVIPEYLPERVQLQPL